MYAIGIMLMGLAILQLFTKQLLVFFNASGQMLDIGIPALRIISISFLFAGFCIISSSVFQALGQGILSLIVSLIRQLVILLPAAYVLSRIGGLNLVWWAFPFAEIFAVVLCTVFLMYVYRKKIKIIPD